METGWRVVTAIQLSTDKAIHSRRRNLDAKLWFGRPQSRSTAAEKPMGTVVPYALIWCRKP